MIIDWLKCIGGNTIQTEGNISSIGEQMKVEEKRVLGSYKTMPVTRLYSVKM
jgi:hypothetical protein